MNHTLYIESPTQLSLREEPAPEPAEDEALIRTECTLVSPGTERMLAAAPDEAGERWRSYMHYPRPTGYCNVGRVEKVWTQTDDSALPVKLGTRVLSHGPHGTYVSQRVDQLVPVPRDLPLETAPFGVMATFPILAVHLARPVLGELAVVIGAGIVGNLCAQMAEAAGCRVMLIDPDQFRIDVAHRCGLVASYAETAEEAAKGIKEETKGGVDIVFEASGRPDAVAPGLKMLRRKGRLILLGSTSGPVTLDLHDEAHTLGLHIIGAQATNMPDRPTSENRWTWQQNAQLFFELVLAGKVRVEPMITHRVVPPELVKTYESLVLSRESPSLGIVVTW